MIPTILNGILVMCLEGWYICERSYEPPKVKYYESGKSCYRDGVFYPRCEDLENKEVQYYHNLFKDK